jgi:ketosteroid isomerase-like protein
MSSSDHDAMHRQTGETIKEGARRLDEALESQDVNSVISCFAEDCVLELLGVRLKGHDGVRSWLDWLFKHVKTISFEPVVITVEGEEFVEEFVVNATMHSGNHVRSHQAEVLTYRNGLVTSLRLYFNPLDFAPATGITGQVAAPLLTAFVRRGLRPYEEIG